MPTGDVSYRTLQALLEQGSESATLDYKELLDFRLPETRVEFAKDVGAMLDRGGHIVVGADSAGIPRRGIAKDAAGDFDEARLRSKIERYISGNFALYSAVHEHSGLLMAIIHVLPHTDGCCVFAADGQYQRPGDDKPRIVFRRGDIYVRHGSSSGRADQADLARIFDKVRRSAVSAEAAALRAAQAVTRANPAHQGFLQGSLGAAVTNPDHRPLALSRSFEFRLSQFLQEKVLRRDGHEFSDNTSFEANAILISGPIRHAGEPDALIAVRADASGTVGVYFQQAVTDGTVDELVAWWVLGAWTVATCALSLLNSAGRMYVGIEIDPAGLGVTSHDRQVIRLSRGPLPFVNYSYSIHGWGKPSRPVMPGTTRPTRCHRCIARSIARWVDACSKTRPHLSRGYGSSTTMNHPGQPGRCGTHKGFGINGLTRPGVRQPGGNASWTTTCVAERGRLLELDAWLRGAMSQLAGRRRPQKLLARIDTQIPALAVLLGLVHQSVPEVRLQPRRPGRTVGQHQRGLADTP
jgi:hypothetical protein